MASCLAAAAGFFDSYEEMAAKIRTSKLTSRRSECLRHLYDDGRHRAACALEIFAQGQHTFTFRTSEVTCPRCKATKLYRETEKRQRRHD